MPETFRCTSVARPDLLGPKPIDLVVLTHDERRVRRTVLTMVHGDRVALDLPEPVLLRHGTRLVLEGGAEVEVIACEEHLIEVTARDGAHLTEIAWHLGNRHAVVQVEADRLLVPRDPVLRRMLEGLGAACADVSEPFEPLRGAYHGHAHDHAHGHAHGHGNGGADADAHEGDGA